MVLLLVKKAGFRPAFLSDNLPVDPRRFCALALHHRMNVPFAFKPFDIEHENFQFAQNIGRKQIAVDFDGNGRVISFS